jgi:hypothetical protein
LSNFYLKEAHFIYKDNETIQIRIFNSIQNVDKEWEALAAQDYFLQPAFLSNIEMQLKEVLVPNYITIYHQNKIIGIIYTQLITFNAQFFNENVKENFLVKLQKNSLYCLLDWIQTKLLVVGNIYLTGQHGFIIDNAFDKNFILNNVVKTLSKHLKTRVSIIKDIQVNELNIDGYNQIEVQPNMIFYNKNWTNFDDYLNALNSKHRVKAKKIISLGSTLQLEKLQTMNSAISQTLYDLYLKMIENASYNLSKINKNYIEQLFYLENAHIYTVKLNGQIEAFFAYFNNGKYATAHYLGYNTALKNNVALYHNVLFFLVKCTIQDGFDYMIWARTALEIKSSVGAKPVKTSILIRHENKYLNACLQKGIQLFTQENWIERHPFK